MSSSSNAQRPAHPKGRGALGGKASSDSLDSSAGQGGVGDAVRLSDMRNQRNLCAILTTISPVSEEHSVANSVVPTIQVGFLEPLAAKTAIAVTGIN
jgi:hypothetical protein